MNWDNQDAEMLDFIENLSAFRREHRSVRQTRFLHGGLRAADGHPDVEWTDFEGLPLQWRDPGLSCLCLTLRCSSEAPVFEPDSDVVFVVFNRDNTPAEVTLPSAPPKQHWIRGIDTSADDNLPVCEIEKGTVRVAAQSVVALVLKPNERK